MVLLSISFENMHQILRNLYDTMTKLCHPDDGHGDGTRCIRSFVLYRLPCLAVALPCGAHRCLFRCYGLLSWACVSFSLT